MTTPPPNSTELAKQGDPQAIADLINRSLQPKGITASVSSSHDGLQIRLESLQVPNQSALVKFVRAGLTSLGVESLHTVQLSGYEIGESDPAWEEELELSATQTAEDPIFTEVPDDEAEILGEADISPVEDSASPEQDDKGAIALLQKNRVLVALGSIALLLGFGWFGYTLVLRSQTPASVAVDPVPAVPESTPTPATPVTTEASPSASTIASPVAEVSPTPTTSPTAETANPFREAVNKAMQAAIETQTAATSDQWQQVVGLWESSITLLQQVPSEDTNYTIAQQKISEYQRNLSYAQQRATAP